MLSDWQQTGLGQPDFGFIDAGHRYEEVRHDLYAFLGIAKSEFTLLFDDYVDRRNFGVKRLVDTELSTVFQPELIRTNWNQEGRGLTDASPMGMVLIESGKTQDGMSGHPTSETVAERLKASRRGLRVLGVKDRVSSVPRRVLRPILRR